ncbi:hypothetical protein AAFC00_006766 [Neodothiora populina]|uniref:Uncharacterized protein n=1 Tax=Neodothiora populina TaxID=2781224 RepID=A0ABR3PB86_9PEZI
MLPALRLRLRDSCLKQLQHHEVCGSLAARRHVSNEGAGNRRLPAQAKKSSAPQVEARKESNNALLAELFPEETQRFAQQDLTRVQHTAVAAAQKHREPEVPRLKLDVPDLPERPKGPDLRPARRAPELPLDKAMYWDSMRDTQRQIVHREKQGDAISVLVLRNASKNLVEEDFRRVIPQGKHIEGWTLDRGDILKVIPGRRTSTLERDNFYYILFKSPVSAFSYQVHVTRLHRLAQSQTPTSLTSPIPPPPGYTVNGENIEAMIQSYSLLPLSQEMDIRQLARPLRPSMQQIVNNLGYPHLVNRPTRMPAEVLLHLEGKEIPMPQIRYAFGKAARFRGLPWTGDDRLIYLEKWDGGAKDISPMGSRGFKFDVAHEEIAGPSDEESTTSLVEPSRRKFRGALQRYIVGFDNQAEAETFVRHWHMQPLLGLDHMLNGDSAPIVNVEVLW